MDTVIVNSLVDGKKKRNVCSVHRRFHYICNPWLSRRQKPRATPQAKLRVKPPAMPKPVPRTPRVKPQTTQKPAPKAAPKPKSRATPRVKPRTTQKPAPKAAPKPESRATPRATSTLKPKIDEKYCTLPTPSKQLKRPHKNYTCYSTDKCDYIIYTDKFGNEVFYITNDKNDIFSTESVLYQQLKKK